MYSFEQVCPFCNEVFRKIEIKDHIGTKHLKLNPDHSQVKQKVCSFCDKAFGINEIRAHIGIEHFKLSPDHPQVQEKLQCEEYPITNDLIRQAFPK